MTYVLGHALPAAALAGLAYLTGWAIEQLALHGAALGGLRHVARWLLGITAWIMTVFVLATVGWLGRGSLSAAVVLALLVAGVAWRRSRSRPAREETVGDRPGWLDVVCGLIALVVLVPLFLLAVGPTVSWDADVYHLTLPRLFLEAGGFVEVPVLVYGHWPLATELLYTAAMALAHYVVAKLIHFGLGVLVMLVVLGAVRREVGSRAAAAGWLAVGLILANDVVAFELRVAYVEWLHALALLAAVLFVSAARDARDPGHERSLLLLAGLACGLMAAVKVTGVLWVPVVAALWLPEVVAAGRRGRVVPEAIRVAVLVGGPVALLWLPWLIKTWWQTGNPIYPFAWEQLGGPWWSSALGEQLASWQRGIGMGRSPADYLLLPWRVATEGGPGYDRFDGRLSPLWLAAVPLAALGARRSPLARRALFVAAGCFILWAASSQQIRFLVPLLPLFALAAAIGFAAALDRLSEGPVRHALAATVAIATLLAGVAAHAATLAAGVQRLELYRTQSSEALAARAAPPVYAAIDRLPADARILMIGTNHGFFCRRPYLADSFFEASQLADWLQEVGDDVDALEQRLAGQQVTHVLLGTRPWPIAWPPALGRLLADRGRVTGLYADRGHRLLALRRR